MHLPWAFNFLIFFFFQNCLLLAGFSIQVSWSPDSENTPSCNLVHFYSFISSLRGGGVQANLDFGFWNLIAEKLKNQYILNSKVIYKNIRIINFQVSNQSVIQSLRKILLNDEKDRNSIGMRHRIFYCKEIQETWIDVMWPDEEQKEVQWSFVLWLLRNRPNSREI